MLGNILCKASFSQHRFAFLLSNLRFDDQTTRNERRKIHGLAPIKKVWDKFLDNCQMYYSPSSLVTIDEQLHAFRGPYVGKGPGSMDNSARHYLTTLTRTFHNSTRNVTFDNWFTQVPVVEELKQKYGLTAVGTLRKNKPEIPPSFTKTASAGTCRYAYNNGMTLLSYCPKKNKVVTLISSYHSRGKWLTSESMPNIVHFYNQTKGGTDEFDGMCKNYSTSRITNRWPLRLFYAILDQAGVNSHVLLNLRPEEDFRRYNRREYLKSLGFDLIKDHLLERMKIKTLQTYIKLSIQNILDLPPEHSVPTIKFDNQLRKKCFMCPPANRKKTVYCCSECHAAACDEYRMHLCFKCR